MTRVVRFVSPHAIARRGVNDEGGASVLWMNEGDIETIQLDWRSLLETGETVSNNALSSQDVSTANLAESSGLVTVSITGPNTSGYIVNTITLSTGRKLSHKVKVRPIAMADAKDYAC